MEFKVNQGFDRRSRGERDDSGAGRWRIQRHDHRTQARLVRASPEPRCPEGVRHVRQSALTWFIAGVNQGYLETLGRMRASGQIRPVIEVTYPLDRVRVAFRDLGEGHSIGKRVIVV